MSAVVAPGTELDRQHRRFQAVNLRMAGLQGRVRELSEQQAKLSTGVSLAKARIELAQQVTEAFNYLQERAHRHAVGEFEDLLSAFVDDVIPGAGRIHLELGTKIGAPSLEIQLDNGGDKESILHGNGGGLTNVVVTGLGYSALSRTKNRQVMLLDEPDCWLKAENVPAFTKVIAEVANPRTAADGEFVPGCQTFMISHNDISLMDEGAHIQDLRKELDVEAYAARHGVKVVYVGEKTDCAYVVWVDGGPHAPSTIEVRYRKEGEGDDENNALTKGFPYLQNISGARSWEDAAQPGIRWIEATNLRRHVCTRLELSSGLNVLTGGVNNGKSQLYFAVLRAMAYGDSDDSMIRHGADQLVIRMGLENDVILELVRKRKGSPKAEYRLYRDGNPLPAHKESQGNSSEPPDFILKALNVVRVDGLDIQLRSQKEPVFLLNETSSVRAQLLSVGRESGLLQELIEHHRQELRRDKDSVKRDELELNSVNRTLRVLSPLAGMLPLMDILSGMFDDAAQNFGAIETLRDLLSRLAPLEGKAKLFEVEGKGLAVDLPLPQLHNTGSLTSLITRLESSQLAGRIPAMPEIPAVPQLHRTGELSTVIESLVTGVGADQVLAYLPAVPAAATLLDVLELTELLVRLVDNGAASKVLACVPTMPLAGDLADTKELRETGVGLKAAEEAKIAAEAENKAASAEANTADDELHKLKHELGVCPACNKPF